MSVLKIKDQNGNWIQIPTIKGEDGQDYVLTEQDKEDIAELIDAPVEDVKIENNSIVDNGIVNIPIASTSQAGVAHINTNNGIGIQDGYLFLCDATSGTIKMGSHQFRAIVPLRQHESVFYGLAKASGDTTQSQSANSVGTYTDEAKASIKNMLGVEDVDLTDYVQNTDYATSSKGGVVKTGNTIGILSTGEIGVIPATANDVKVGTNSNNPITPSRQNASVFYGLAKASGDITQSASSNEVGTYTDDAKSAIQTMLGVPSADDVVTDVQVNGTSVTTDGVATIPIANGQNTLGLTQYNSTYGVTVNANGRVQVFPAISSEIKGGTNDRRPITPSVQHESAFYGLAKAAGDSTQSASNNAVGTYTDDAKTAIQTMLGVPSEDDVVDDVQINGTSIVNNGVANIPIASTTEAGVIRIGSGDLGIAMSGDTPFLIGASSNHIKSASPARRVIFANMQHESVFYGLAKAAGDTTQSSSSNAVGTYTDSAKTAIKQMLDVKDDYDSLVVEVSGTDPVITGKPSYRYNCGELYTLSITPPASGTMDIIFTSGTTPTVLTLPNTVKMPDWWAGIETNTTYEMCITDGTYCGVMSWAT